MAKKSKKKSGTILQKRLANELILAIKNKDRVTMQALLEKVGYSKEVARAKPGEIIQSEGVQKELDPFIKILVAERNRAVGMMRRKISKAKYRDLVDAVDKLTKNIQLLSGGRLDGETNNFFIDQRQYNAIIAREARSLKDGGQA